MEREKSKVVKAMLYDRVSIVDLYRRTEVRLLNTNEQKRIKKAK